MDETLQKHMDKKTGCGKVIFVTLFSILFILVGAEVIVSHVVKHEPVQTWEYYAYTLIFVLWVVGITVKLKNTNIMKNVVVISTSLRPGSNSNMLAEQFAEGARVAGHQVEFISLRDKEIKFCIGCLSCQKTGACVIEDDVPAIMESVLNADVVCWATPIYYYEMSGQMKTLIDRMNAMYPKDYRFREVYLLTTAAENEDYTSAGTENGLMGWIECYEKSELKGHLFCGGVGGPKEIEGNAKLHEAYEMGKNI
jgi:putative NADPH-quinone reductase